MVGETLQKLANGIAALDKELYSQVKGLDGRKRENERARNRKEVVDGGKMADVWHRIMRKPNRRCFPLSVLCSTKLLCIFDSQVVTNYEDLLSQATGIEALESKSMPVNILIPMCA